MPLFGSSSGDAQTWAPQAADSRLAHTAGAEAAANATTPTFTLGLDS